MAVDWAALETEYITNTETSYRKLADKYGMNHTVIARKASEDGWVEKRKQFVSDTQAKTLEKISQQEASRAAKIHSVADKLLNKIEAMADSGRPMNSRDIRALTAAIRDLKEIQNVRSEMDKKEQQARIDRLRRDAEYITNTETSYRKLADKYGMNHTVIARKASEDGWVEKRKQFVSDTQAKTLEKISQQEASRAAKIHSVADKLLNKIEAMADSGRPMNSRDIRALTAAIRDLKEIQNVRSEMDKKEQQARIDRLRRDAEGDKQDKMPTLIIEGLPEEFKV